MKTSEIEILNAGRSEITSILTADEMLMVRGGLIQCNKGYTLTNEGKVQCACGFIWDRVPPTGI